MQKTRRRPMIVVQSTLFHFIVLYIVLYMSLSAQALGALWSLTWRFMYANITPTTPTRTRRRVRACVYCGDPATTADHLRPVIGKGGLPTGFGADEWNIVPACSTCNSSKGNQDWYTFMTRTTGKAPLARGVSPAVNAWRIGRLKTFERNGAKAATRWTVHRHKQDIEDMRIALRKAMSAHERLVHTMKSRASWRGQRRQPVPIPLHTRKRK